MRLGVGAGSRICNGFLVAWAICLIKSRCFNRKSRNGSANNSFLKERLLLIYAHYSRQEAKAPIEKKNNGSWLFMKWLPAHHATLHLKPIRRYHLPDQEE